MMKRIVTNAILASGIILLLVACCGSAVCAAPTGNPFFDYVENANSTDTSSDTAGNGEEDSNNPMLALRGVSPFLLFAAFAAIATSLIILSIGLQRISGVFNK